MRLRVLVIVPLLALAAVGAIAREAPHQTELLATTTTWDGKPIAYSQTTQPKVRAVKVEIPAGEATAWHQHPVGNYAYLLSGKLRLEVKDGQSHVFEAGQAFAEVVNTTHRGVSLGTEPVVIIVWYMGAADAPITIPEPPASK
jgi:quercetin dioxygenase-like cupin family protein